jgi:hypothetical protein
MWAEGHMEGQTNMANLIGNYTTLPTQSTKVLPPWLRECEDLEWMQGSKLQTRLYVIFCIRIFHMSVYLTRAEIRHRINICELGHTQCQIVEL